MDAFEYKGTWWVPQFPNDKLVGTLTFDPTDPIRGLSLVTQGDHFYKIATELARTRPDSRQSEETTHNRQLDTIHGLIDFYQPITLHRCTPFGDRLLAGIAFIGCFFEKEDDLVFDSVRVRYTDLDNWVGITGFTKSFELNRERYVLDGSLEYETPKQIDHKVGDLTFSIFHKLRAEKFVFNDIHLKQFTYIEISSENGTRYDDYHRKVILPLREFFQVALNKAVFPLTLYGYSHLGLDRRGNVFEKGIAICFVAEGATSEEPTPFDPFRILFHYSDVQEHWGMYLQKWFEIAEKLRPILDLYFGLFYIPPRYTDLELLILTQVLEAYHRRMHDGEYLSVGKYAPILEELIKAIPSTVNSDHRQKLENLLKFGYEYSLGKRLKLIFEEILAPYEGLVNQLFPKRSEFINKLKDTRDYLTHYTDELREKSITDSREQNIYVDKVRLIIQLCFLAELGFPLETVERIANRNESFQV